MSVTLLDVPRKLADLEREMNQITVKQSLKENMLEAHNEKDLSAEEFHEHFNPEEAALVLRKWLKA
jgi:hypothetical protein